MTGRHAAPFGWEGENGGLWPWPDGDVRATRRMLRQIVNTLEQAPTWLRPELVDALEAAGMMPPLGDGDLLGFLVRDYRGEADDGRAGYYGPAAPQGALEAAAECGGTVTPLVAMRDGAGYRRRWLTGMPLGSGQRPATGGKLPASQRPWAEGVVPL